MLHPASEDLQIQRRSAARKCQSLFQTERKKDAAERWREREEKEGRKKKGRGGGREKESEKEGRGEREVEGGR